MRRTLELTHSLQLFYPLFTAKGIFLEQRWQFASEVKESRMARVRSGDRVDEFAAKLWAWSWGALFVVAMTVLSVYSPALSGYTPPADQTTTVASLPAVHATK